jgi:[acyl-carrier-protein] S-malonyltransferase
MMMNRHLFLQFPGVGSHQTGMGEAFYRSEKTAKETFEEASDVLQFDVARLCFDPDERMRLNQLQFSQVALVTTSVAIFRAIAPRLDLGRALFAGYSLGEYSALCCAGAMAFSDALNLVWRRGLTLRKTGEEVGGSMLWVVNLREDHVADICEHLRAAGQKVWLSAIDSELKYTISGTTEAIAQASELIITAGGIPLATNVTGPYHSPLMTKATLTMQSLLDRCALKVPEHPVISNLTARMYQSAADIRHDLAHSLTNAVQWKASLTTARQSGADIAAEIGPNEVLTFVWKKNFDDTQAIAVSEPKGAIALDKILGDRERDMGRRLVSAALRTLVVTPNRNPDIEDHRTTTVVAYRALLDFGKKLEAGAIEVREIAPTIRTLTVKALQGMGYSVRDTDERISQIFNHNSGSGGRHAAH